MKYFGIFDEKSVCDLKLKGKKTVLIRILEPNNITKTPINNIDDYIAVLELHIFDYVSKVKDDILNKNFFLLNEFILNNNFDEIIVHCSLGISRSPAIMICISKILDNLEMEGFIKENFKFYNRIIVKNFEQYAYIIKKTSDNKFVYGYSNLRKRLESIDKELIDINYNTKKYLLKK